MQQKFRSLLLSLAAGLAWISPYRVTQSSNHSLDLQMQNLNNRLLHCLSILIKAWRCLGVISANLVSFHPGYEVSFLTAHHHTAWQSVMTKLWKEVLSVTESLLLPPLSDQPTEMKPLTDKEVDIVFMWLKVLSSTDVLALLY